MDATSWQRACECALVVARSFARATSICLVVGWMLFAQGKATAQQFSFRHYPQTEGLGNPVWSISPGTDHSVLLATRAGCSRLDPGASLLASCPFSSFPPGEIRVMAQGRGALWVGMTTGGLFRIVTARSGWRRRAICCVGRGVDGRAFTLAANARRPDSLRWLSPGAVGFGRALPRTACCTYTSLGIVSMRRTGLLISWWRAPL
jgi:hypothetical protein